MYFIPALQQGLGNEEFPDGLILDPHGLRNLVTQFYVLFQISMFFGKVTIIFVNLISTGIVLRPIRIRSKRELITCTGDIAATPRIPEGYLSERVSCVDIGVVLIGSPFGPDRFIT
jgi:hypothetical protein